MREKSLAGEDFAELSAEILARGSRVRFRARGRSMAPLIRDGDVLTVEPVSMEALRVGDIVFHRAGPGRLVAHRVVTRDVENAELTLTTRGDALLGPGERVRADDVLGRVVELQRGNRLVCLDQGWRRVVGVLWARLSPLPARLARLVSRAVRMWRKARSPKNRPGWRDD